MEPQFIGRQKEFDFLRKVDSKPGFKLVVLYGRRRIGKTELIKNFLKGKSGEYILFSDENLEENLKELKEKFFEITKKDFFLSLQTESIYDLFKYLVEEIKDKKIVIAIDEFSYLLNLNKGFLSTFQKIIDELLKDTQITLILCGSSLSIMENDLLGYKSPLYGRNVNAWKLMPFNFETVYSIDCDIFVSLEKYFVFGNVPYYLFFYDGGKDLFENVRENILTKGIGLYDEPLILLRQEFRESRIYRLILKYISMGYKSIGKLSSITGMDKSNIMKYLSTLEETNLIRHILPLGLKRKGVYEVSDPFFRFWFKFVYPNKDKLEMGNIKSVEEIINKELNSYFGFSFEYLIEELLNEGFFEELSEFSRIEKWWHKDKEIDVVALNDSKKEILFGECKWKEKVNALEVLKDLEEKTKFVDWNLGKRKESFAVFAKSFSKKVKEFNGKKVHCFELKDLGRVCKSL
jgi:uncharacterized protein